MPAPFSEDLRWRVIWFVHVLQHSVLRLYFSWAFLKERLSTTVLNFLVTGDVACVAGYWRCKVGDNRPFIRGNQERLSIEKSVSFFCL